MDQCSILYVKAEPREDTHVQALRALGFSVDVADDIPASEIITKYHAVVIRAHAATRLPSLGARMRVKPHFGRRVLIALVCDAVPVTARRDAQACGFDVVLAESCPARDLAAHILRGLRPFPEYRCLLRTPNGRRKAA